MTRANLIELAERLRDMAAHRVGMDRYHLTTAAGLLEAAAHDMADGERPADTIRRITDAN